MTKERQNKTDETEWYGPPVDLPAIPLNEEKTQEQKQEEERRAKIARACPWGWED